MAKKGSTQTQVTRPDEFTDAARQQTWHAATMAASQPYRAYGGQRVAGVNPMTMRGLNGAFDAITNFQKYQPGTFANADLSGYMNPYQQSVIQGVQGDYDRIRQQSMNAVNDRATAAGAFGGSRHGVATGTALADVGRAEASQLAGLRQAGYEDAAGRFQTDQARMDANQLARLGTAGQLANLGLSGGGYLRNVQQQGLDAKYGDYLEGRDWNLRNLGILSGTLGGLPQGSTTETHTPGSGLSGILGGAMSLGSMFLPGGPLAGIFGGGGFPGNLPVDPMSMRTQGSFLPMPTLMGSPEYVR